MGQALRSTELSITNFKKGGEVMKRLFCKEEGFSLIEMLIVLLIISVLLLITLPNVTKHSASIDEKGCEAFVQMAQGQAEAYKMDNGKYPTSIKELEGEGYLKTNAACPDGRTIIIDDGKVSVGGGS